MSEQVGNQNVGFLMTRLIYCAVITLEFPLKMFYHRVPIMCLKDADLSENSLQGPEQAAFKTAPLIFTCSDLTAEGYVSFVHCLLCFHIIMLDFYLEGNCVFSPVKKTTCRACRLRKCLEGGLLKGESLTRLTALFYQKYIIPSTDKPPKKKDSVSSLQPNIPSGPSNVDTSPPGMVLPVIPVPVTYVPSMGPPSVPRLATNTMKSPGDKSSNKMKLPVVTTPESGATKISDVQPKTKATKISEVQPKTVIVSDDEDDRDFESPIKVRTLSGEIREHKRKKQKAFKELLRTKQERTENLLAIPGTDIFVHFCSSRRNKVCI